MKKIKVGILGCGTIGEGVAKILIEKKDFIRKQIGFEIELAKIADLDWERKRATDLSSVQTTTDSDAIINDEEISIVVETIGGTSVAKKLIMDAISKKKHIVTANKALLANCGEEILTSAEKQKLNVGFEASVGGCMPIIKSLKESLIVNEIKSMKGILNGTCNFILSNMTNNKSSFDEALKKAQELGYAEADPSLDVDGNDTAYKLAILNTIAYGMKNPFSVEDLYFEGISKIEAVDIEFAEEFGYKIKLLAISKNNNGKIEARVHPAMIDSHSALANVEGPFNAINLVGDAVGSYMLYGYGAGMMPTASAVCSDIIDIAKDINSNIQLRSSNLSYMMKAEKKPSVFPMEDLLLKYYIRFSAVDKPGVCSKISGILANYDISIESLRQISRHKEKLVPLIMLTHKTKEQAIQNALKDISALDIVPKEPVLIRIEDEASLS